MLLLTSPFTPMLFMGEEWGAVSPWQYFTSHPEPELGAAVAAGRRREFTRHGWPPGRVPDPQEQATFHRSQLDWSELDKPAHRELLDLHRELIALRRSRPELADPRLTEVEVCHGDRHLVIHRGGCRVVANLAGRPQRVELAADGPRGAAEHRARCHGDARRRTAAARDRGRRHRLSVRSVPADPTPPHRVRRVRRRHAAR